MAEDKTPSPWNPDGIKKSNSARSTKSHHSLRVLGAHPLGSLRVLRPDDSLTDVSDREDSPPPPLDPPSSVSSALLELPYRTRAAVDVALHVSPDNLMHILDLPETYTVGYDAVSFTGKHFIGIREIPTGPHFLWVAHPEGQSTRHGVWSIASEVRQHYVIQWDDYNECFDEASDAVKRNSQASVDSFYGQLVPCRDLTAWTAAGGSRGPIDKHLRIWEQLTRSITEKVLSRVTGQQGSTWHVHTTDRVQGAILLASEIELDKTIRNPLLQARELKFSFSQHSKTYSANTFGAARTLAATDATRYITSMIDSPDNDLSDEDIVGEFQFAFLVAVFLGNEACLQQWWHMVLKLILKAYLLPAEQPVLAAALLQTIATQLTYNSDYLDASILDHNADASNDMRLALIVYKRRLEEFLDGLGASAAPAQLAVGTVFAKLEAAVVGLGWDLQGDYLRKGKVMMEDGEEVEVEMAELQAEDERGEWAPEIVELDEHGRQRDLVSWSD